MPWVTPINWLAKAVGYPPSRADMQTISDDLNVLQREVSAGYATADVTVTAIDPYNPDLVVNLPTATYDGRTVQIEFSAPSVEFLPNNAAHYLSFPLWDYGAGASLGLIALCGAGTTGIVAPIYGRIRIAPTAGAHTYSVRASKTDAGDSAVVYGGWGGTSVSLPIVITATYV